MKYRKDFVTNSSSSSYVCDICGREEIGMDIGLRECEMIECVNGHIICNDETLNISKKDLIKLILENEYNEITEVELNDETEDSLFEILTDIDDMIYEMPECFCPICQFIEYSQNDLSKYLEKEYHINREEVFAEVKKINKRRKKLYENEYITYVCQKFNLNPTEIVASWKEKFKSYNEFRKFLRK